MAIRQVYLLIHLTETWRTALDSGSLVAAALIYFRKAFDSISHNTLVTKLKTDFGITGMLLDFLKCYLSERRQFMGLNDQICFGCPLAFPRDPCWAQHLLQYLQTSCQPQSTWDRYTCLLTILHYSAKVTHRTWL